MNEVKCRRLQLLRESRGLTQQDLADELGLSRSTIAMMESGKREGSIDVISSLATFFEMDVEFIEGRETKMDIIKEYLLSIPLDKNNNIPTEVIPSLVTKIQSYIRSLKE